MSSQEGEEKLQIVNAGMVTCLGFVRATPPPWENGNAMHPRLSDGTTGYLYNMHFENYLEVVKKLGRRPYVRREGDLLYVDDPDVPENYLRKEVLGE